MTEGHFIMIKWWIHYKDITVLNVYSLSNKSFKICELGTSLIVLGFPGGAYLVAQMVKLLPTMRETWVQSLGQEDPLEKEMATHSSILAWKIPWTEEPGRLQSMASQRVGHDWATSLSLSLSLSTLLKSSTTGFAVACLLFHTSTKTIRVTSGSSMPKSVVSS